MKLHQVVIIAVLVILTLGLVTQYDRAAESRTTVFAGPSEERDSIVAYEARRAGMDPALAIAVSHVENWGGDSAVRHRTSGAIGLMQIMPFWADSFQAECYGGRTLFDRHRNACVGAHIGMRYFGECGNWNCALVAYVGARCRPTDSPERCARKTRIGAEYVLEVVERFGRTDLSPARDAMASGSYRPVQILGLGTNSSGDSAALRRASAPGAP